MNPTIPPGDPFFSLELALFTAAEATASSLLKFTPTLKGADLAEKKIDKIETHIDGRVLL